MTVIEHDLLVWPAARLDDHGVTPEDLVSCAGHAAYVGWGYSDGERRAGAVFVCRDVLAHGHVDAAMVPAEGRRGLSEQEKAARRVVVERNKQWRSASTVRRDWLRSFAARKTVPPGAERFIAICLLSGDHCLRQAMEAGWPLLRELLGYQVGPGDGFRAGGAQFAAVIESLSTASAKRLTVLVVVAAVLSAWEDRTGVHSWRHPSAETARYLRQMQAWGYELSDIEIIAALGDDPGTDNNGDGVEVPNEADADTDTDTDTDMDVDVGGSEDTTGR